MLNTRHWALIGYSVLCGIAVFKDIIHTPEAFAVAVGPIAAAFAYDKITALRNQSKTN